MVCELMRVVAFRVECGRLADGERTSTGGKRRPNRTWLAVAFTPYLTIRLCGHPERSEGSLAPERQRFLASLGMTLDEFRNVLRIV
jgi:hypothetical protein